MVKEAKKLNTKAQAPLNFDAERETEKPLHFNLKVYASPDDLGKLLSNATQQNPDIALQPNPEQLQEIGEICRLSVEISKRLHKKLKTHAVNRDKLIKEIIAEFVEGLPE